jgi:xanthosine utilization system XapX-like protein
VEASGNIEVLFAVTDYSNLYSGLVYPPAFGKPEAVSRLLSARLILRSLFVTAALTVGLLSIMLGLLARKDALALLFGLLCLTYVGYAAYPITRTLVTGYGAQYAVERCSFCAMLCVSMVISMRICGLPRKPGVPFLAFGFLMCALSAGSYLVSSLGNLRMMLIYSWLVSAYEWVAAGFIAAAVIYSIKKSAEHIAPLLCGVVILVCALAADRLLPLHEPILTGWFIELASFALVLSIGVVTVQDVSARYKESTVSTERANSMERLYQSQLSFLQTLRHEMDEAKTLRHDMRHHFAILGEYQQNRQYDKLAEYLKEYSDASAGGELPDYCPIDVINVLTHHYDAMARRGGIRLEIRCELSVAENPGQTGMSSADLCSLYSNLMENAVEACLRVRQGEKCIRVTVIRIEPGILNLRVRNTAQDIRKDGGRFLSAKQHRRRGYGLPSVEATAAKYGGKAEFSWNAKKNEFESKVTVKA